MTATKVIESRAASLQTATVSIQTLNVNGKQMTLAVFRQLPVITSRLPLTSGMYPWGFVLYSIDKHTEWLVLEMGGRLYRKALQKQFQKWSRSNDCWEWQDAPFGTEPEWLVEAVLEAQHLMRHLPQLFIAV